MISNVTSFSYLKYKLGTDSTYILEQSLIWDLLWKGSPWKLIVPVNYEFSISRPRTGILRFICECIVDPHNINWLVAAAIHDWMLDNGSDKAIAAAEFRRVLIARGQNIFISWLVFLSVLVFTLNVTHKLPPE